MGSLEREEISPSRQIQVQDARQFIKGHHSEYYKVRPVPLVSPQYVGGKIIIKTQIYAGNSS